MVGYCLPSVGVAVILEERALVRVRIPATGNSVGNKSSLGQRPWLDGLYLTSAYLKKGGFVILFAYMILRSF